MERLIFVLIILGLGTALFFAIKSLLKFRKESKLLKEKLEPVTDVEKHVEAENAKLNSLKTELTELEQKFQQGKSIFKELEDEIKLFEENKNFIEHGVYEPLFDFEHSENYKEEITHNKGLQKEHIQDGQAAVCDTEWTVEGSRAKGRTMANRAIKLTLRAFNGECDALIAKVKWNNVTKIEQRIKKIAETINKLNASNNIYLTDEYIKLKIEELYLTHEHAEKKYEEKEEQRRIREQMREEELAEREIRKAQEEAEKEERQYQKALEKVQKELKGAKDEEVEKLNAELAKLQEALDNAHEAKERAISRAQMTKSGHVYIISNIGSFGEEVYKIGMTRRLDPIDRVKELGDASVPFQFDVHAMIYSDNAPELENKLHKEFAEKRVNMINRRKEYFNVTIDEIEEIVNSVHDAQIEFTKVAEAKEYHETLAYQKEQEQEEVEVVSELEKFPENLF